jgi:NADPH:quinone reductase-like Zn-dependent oxidoreductase
MRVVGVDEFGGPDVLKVFEVPEAHAGPGEVRIRVLAATVNPTDTYTRNGDRAALLRSSPPPYVSGMDAAGVIDEVGSGVDHVAVGDRVMAIVIPHASHGAYSEKLVLPADSVVHAPAGTSHAEASTLPMNGLTARLTLDVLELAPGNTLAVTGAAGCYGGYTVQLAKTEGLRVIADAAPADEELVRSFGADVVVPRGPDVAAHIRHIVPDGVDALADGSVQSAAVVAAVRDGGSFASVRGFVGESARAITFHQIWVREYARRRDKLDELRALAEAGALTLRVAKTFPAEQAAEAHRLLHAGGVRGRLVLEF